MKLLSHSLKTEKTDNAGKGYLSTIVYLQPCKKLCPNCSPGCMAACLNTSGRGKCNSVQNSRKVRTDLWLKNREAFKSQIVEEITAFVRKCERAGKLPAVRINGTSDIPLERDFPELFAQFPNVQFYDYTKNANRMSAKLPANYHLTFSRSETNFRTAINLAKLGYSVAVVFDRLPTKYMGLKVVEGDSHDLRFLDPPNCVVGLTAKGRAKHDKSGFVVRI